MKRTLVIHPFLFALFPVLFIYSQNLEQMSLSHIWTSVIVLLVSALVLLVPFALILRSIAKAGMLVSLFLILFFSYGVVHRALWEGSAEIPALYSQILLIVWLVILAGGAALIVRLRRGLREITTGLNLMAVVLVSFSLFTIVTYEFRTRTALRDSARVETVRLGQAGTAQADALPDIYYIILDGYARADVLKDLYNYDNSEFLAFLEQRGFFVADASQANYAQTALSLASSLNLGYLDDLASRVAPEYDDRQPLQRLIRDSAVVEFLEQQGYVTAALDSGYPPTTLEGVDVLFGPGVSWNALEILLLGNTPVPWLVARESQLNPFMQHIGRLQYALDHLAETAELQSPHFVFAHVVAPHPPFVVDEHGNETPQNREFNIEDGNHFLEMGGTSEEYVEGYLGQLKYVNDQMRTVIDDLLAIQASRPAIIILQADHGPGLRLDWEEPENTYFRERLAIFNAIRLPGGESTVLYDGMTPVNTFRLLFNQYLGTELELLEDESYFSTWDQPYVFINVTDEVRAGEPARQAGP
jgi:hypothetical protein